MVRVAAYQLKPHATLEKRIEQLHKALSKADRENVGFVCFPEGFLTGYYSEKNQALENSFHVRDSKFQDLLNGLKHYHATIILGFNEQDEGHLFDSVAVIEQGKLLGIQRKHYLYHPYFTPGTTFIPFSSKGICFGVMVCLDSMYFEPARLLALQGAEILFCPMCNKVDPSHPYVQRPVYYSHLIARSFENRCWVVSADWVGSEQGLVCPGHSVVYDPNGQEIKRSKEGQEELLIVDIPKDSLFKDKGRRIQGSSMLAQKISQIQQSL